jgi:hypothetical protein
MMVWDGSDGNSEGEGVGFHDFPFLLYDLRAHGP